MLKGNKPSYPAIESFCFNNNFIMKEYGDESIIGEKFITCKKDNVTISLILEGYNTKFGEIYEVIYSDLIIK